MSYTVNTAYRISALLLALSVFIASTGFTIDKHYCQDQLKSISFFGKAKSCHEMASKAVMPNCPHHQNRATSKEGCKEGNKDCCHNKTQHFQSDQENQIQPIVLDKPLKQFITAYISVFYNNSFVKKDAPKFNLYKPPIVIKDIPVLIESFLL